MQPKFKLPDYSRASVTQPTFKPFQTSTSQSGGFTGLKPFGTPLEETQTEVEVDAQIKSLQSQVANLEKRLLEVGAGEEVDSRNWFEKFTNLPEGQVWWMDVFDIIDRPLQALKYGLTDKSLGSAWQAFSGNREYMSGVDFLDNLGFVRKEELNDAETLLLNLGVDIFADPLNYISPVGILRKLGILSDVKVTAKFETLMNTMRKDGLVRVTDDLLAEGLEAARRAGQEALGQSGRNIDDILRLADDQLDDIGRAAKQAYTEALQRSGIFTEDGFRQFVGNYGQFIDPKTGKLTTYLNKTEADKAFQAGTEAVLKAGRAVTKRQRVLREAQAVLARGAFNSTQEAAAAARNVQNATESLARAQRALEIAQETQRATIQNVRNFLDAFYPKNRQGVRKAIDGAEGELFAGDALRKAMQKRADEVFADGGVIAVNGSPRGTGVDIEFFRYDPNSKTYIRIQKKVVDQAGNATYIPFKFEVKDIRGAKGRFGFKNPSLRVVSAEDLDDITRQIDELPVKSGPDYDALVEEKEEILAALATTEPGGIGIILSNGRVRQNLGREGVIRFNELFRDMLKASGTTGIKFEDYLTITRRVLDEAKKLGVKSSSETKALFKNDDFLKKVFEGLDQDVIDAYTLSFKFNPTDEVMDFTSEFAKLDLLDDTNDAFGIVRKGANGEDELIILTKDEFFNRLTYDSFELRTSPERNQVQRHIKYTLNQDAVIRKGVEIHPSLKGPQDSNEWFFKQFGDTVTEVAEEGTQVFAGLERTYKPGLVIKMMNAISKSKIPLVAPLAEFISKTSETIAFAFNATKGIEDELGQAIARLSAEGQQIAKSSVDRFEFIVEEVIKKNKGRLPKDEVRRIVSTILESGWDGIETAGRSVSMQGLLQRALIQFKRTGKVILPKFDNPTTLRNFTDELARLFAGQGLGLDFFKLTDKGKYSLLEFADGTTIRELEDLISALPPTIAETQLSFGKAVLSADELRFARQYNDEIQTLINEQKNIQNILLEELGYNAFPEDILGTGAYFRHSINPEMLRILKRNSPASIKKFLDAGTDMLRDRTYIGSIDEINAGLKELFNIPIDVFSTNATYNFADLVRVAMNKREMQLVLKELLEGQDKLGRALFEVVDDSEAAVRGMRTQYKILDKSFKAEFPNLFKNISPEAQEVLLKYFADKGFAEGAKVIATHRAAYNVLKRLDNAYVNLPEFIKSFDQFMGFWKSFALITPGYHMRNLFGNMTNSYLAGMSMPSQVRFLGQSSKDFSFYRRVRRALIQGEDISKLPKYMQEAYERVDEFYRIGISQSHKGVKDLEVIKEGLDAARGGRRSLPKKVADSVVNMNYHIAESMDDMQRYALYQWGLGQATRSKGYRVAKKAGANLNELKAIQTSEASRIVSEALFDYSHLTPFEKEYMKRLFPFFTFFKNNLIFQAKNIFQRPQQYGKLYRSYKYYTESMTGYDLEDIPDYMTGNLWVPLPFQVNRDDDETITWLKLNLPPTDFTEFIENPFSRGVTSVTVPIKLAIELGTGRDTFTGQPLTDFPGQRSRYQEPGFLQGFRDEGGRLTISQDPVMIKLLNDLGLRTMINYASIGVDTVDYLQGTQELDFTRNKILDSLGISRQQDIRKMDIAALYQQLDRLRDQQKLYEQEVGELPTLKELEEMFGQPEQKEQRPLFGVFGT